MGDYIASLVPDRIDWVGVAGSVQRQGVNWTLNTDWPAGVSPSLMYAAWNVVNRVTRSGKPFAPHERVSAYDAMRSLTINAAYQYKEEKSKGTLEVGKLADLVVLDRNPLKVHPMSIKDIQVVQTLKEGVLVYNRKPAATAMVAPGFRAGQIDQMKLGLDELAGRALHLLQRDGEDGVGAAAAVVDHGGAGGARWALCEELPPPLAAAHLMPEAGVESAVST
jgi:hypothetical protein